MSKRTKSLIVKLRREIRELESDIEAEENLRAEEGVDSMNLDKAYEELDALYDQLNKLAPVV